MSSNLEQEAPPKIQEEYTKKHTSPATTVSVVAAPSDARVQYIIDAVWCSGSSSGTLQILDSDDAEIDGYFFTFSSNSGFVIENRHLKQIPKGKGFKYTTTDGGNHAVGFKYHKKVHENG